MAATTRRTNDAVVPDNHMIPATTTTSPTTTSPTSRRSRSLGLLLAGLVLVAFQALETPLHLAMYREQHEEATTTRGAVASSSSLGGARRLLQSLWNINSNTNMNNKDEQDSEAQDDPELTQGVTSQRPQAFFDQIRKAMDDIDPVVRCQRYGFEYRGPSSSRKGGTRGRQSQHRRNIYYGVLVASEPWELWDIVGAEAHGLFSGIVLVEANRTQNLTPRPWRRAHQPAKTAARIRRLFGNRNAKTPLQVDIRQYVTDNMEQGLTREHQQRDEILRGWKAMGMRPNDVGILADADEMLTRDFLTALQICHVPALGDDNDTANTQQCRHPIGIRGSALVFESSPECITQLRASKHPSAIPGFCIQGIGQDPQRHYDTQIRDADGVTRAKGYGGGGNWKRAEPHVPLYNGADFRKIGGGTTPHNGQHRMAPHTAFHFHNFFSNHRAVRFKYGSYGHAQPAAAASKPLEELHEDLQFTARCVKEQADGDDAYKRLKGGFDALLPNRPVYFEDVDYRRARHALVKSIVEEDERQYGTSSSTAKQ